MPAATTMLRHPHAAARRGRPTWSSSTIICCAPTRRCDRARYGEVIPACSHAIVDEAHQLEDVATQYFGFSVSNYRVEELARDVERLIATGGSTDRKAQDEIAKAVETAARPRAGRSSPSSPFAHRGERPAARRRTGARDRDIAGRHARAGRVFERRARLVESTLALLNDAGSTGPAGRGERRPIERETSRRWRAGPATMRDELRFLLRAGDAEYVYFVEFRGRGIFLRAAPIDVSKIVREFLFDRMRTTVLTSATLTVDGRFDYIRESAGHRRGRANSGCRPSSISRGRPSCICRRACRTRARRSSRWPPGARSSRS